MSKARRASCLSRARVECTDERLRRLPRRSVRQVCISASNTLRVRSGKFAREVSVALEFASNSRLSIKATKALMCANDWSGKATAAVVDSPNCEMVWVAEFMTLQWHSVPQESRKFHTEPLNGCAESPNGSKESRVESWVKSPVESRVESWVESWVNTDKINSFKNCVKKLAKQVKK